MCTGQEGNPHTQGPQEAVAPVEMAQVQTRIWLCASGSRVMCVYQMEALNFHQQLYKHKEYPVIGPQVSC